MEIAEFFREKNIKKTTPRVAIVNILLGANDPLSESDIKEKMGCMYDRSTFYRSIQTLLDAEMIHRIIVDNTNVKYALNEFGYNEAKSDKSHAHFYCRECHTVLCLNTTVPHFNLPLNYKMEECEVLIKGVCGKCISTSSK